MGRFTNVMYQNKMIHGVIRLYKTGTKCPLIAHLCSFGDATIRTPAAIDCHTLLFDVASDSADSRVIISSRKSTRHPDRAGRYDRLMVRALRNPGWPSMSRPSLW